MGRRGRIKRYVAAWAVLILTALLLVSCSGGVHKIYEQRASEDQASTGEIGEPETTEETTAETVLPNISGEQDTTKNTEPDTTQNTAQDTTQNAADAAYDKAPDSSSAAGPTALNKANTRNSTTTQTTKLSSSTTSATSPIIVTPPSASVGNYMVGYYAGWASSWFSPDKIQASKLTHLNYAFAKIGSDLKIALIDSASDIRNFSGLRQLKAVNPSLKTLISVGGWSDSAYFSDAALTAYSREIFAQSCLDFIRKYGFDGVDLDWEYPVGGGMAGNKCRPEDKQNFTSLLQAIRNKLNEQGRQDGKTYCLTIAGGASSSYVNRIEAQKVSGLVDYIFIMGYDMHGPWDPYSDFNAPLYAPTESSPQYKIGDYDAVNAYTNVGVPPSKLVLGMPFYGRKYAVTSSVNHGLYSPYTSAQSISYDTIVSSFLNNSAYTLFYHSSAEVPYLYGNKTFISFDNSQSITAKVMFAKYRRLAGAGAWELSQDRNGVLLKSAYDALRK